MNAEREHLHLGLHLADRYRLTKDVATGSLCAIYGGEDVTLARPVIVKAVAPRTVTAYRAALERTATLTHPDIVATYDAVEHDGWLFIVQEFLPFRSLAAHLGTGLTAGRTLDLLGQLARLLAYTHEQGVIHGDLRPEAVLVDRQARIHVNNFGLPSDPAYVATVAAQIAWAASRERETTIAPVLPDLSRESGDVWAMGALAWQFLSAPVPDVPADDGEWRQVREDVPEAMCALVRRCCYPGEPDALETAWELAEACEAVEQYLQANRPATAPETPLTLRAARERLAVEEPVSPFGVPRSGEPQVIGGRASNSVFNAPTDPIFADAAATHPAGSPGVEGGQVRPLGAPRLRLPSRPIGESYSPFTSTPPHWDSVRRATAPRGGMATRTPGRVGLIEVLALGCVLFVIFFVIGFLWLGPSVLQH